MAKVKVTPELIAELRETASKHMDQFEKKLAEIVPNELTRELLHLLKTEIHDVCIKVATIGIQTDQDPEGATSGLVAVFQYFVDYHTAAKEVMKKHRELQQNGA